MNLKRTTFFLAMVLFFTAVPFAMYYNLNYDKYGAIDRDPDPVFIRLVTVNAAKYNTAIRLQAAKYNRSVKILVLPLSGELECDWDIKIIVETTTNSNDSSTAAITTTDSLHAFISNTQSPAAIRHCENFLSKMQTETEYKLIWKKS